MAVKRCLRFGGHGHNCPCKICRNFLKNLGYIWKLQMYAHFPFYGRFCVLSRYLILEYLQVLNKNWNIIFFFKNNNIFVQYIFYFLFKVCYNNHLALIRLLYCRARAEPNQNKIHLGHVYIIPVAFCVGIFFYIFYFNLAWQ